MVVQMDHHGFLEKVCLYDDKGLSYFLTSQVQVTQLQSLMVAWNRSRNRPVEMGENVALVNPINVTIFPLRRMENDQLVFDVDVHVFPTRTVPKCPSCGEDMEVTTVGLRCINIHSCYARRLARTRYFCSVNERHFGSWFSGVLEHLTTTQNISPLDVYDPDIIQRVSPDIGPGEKLAMDLCRKELLEVLEGRGAASWTRYFLLSLINSFSIPGLTRKTTMLTIDMCEGGDLEHYFVFLADLIQNSHPHNHCRPASNHEVRRLPLKETLGFPDWHELSVFVAELRKLDQVLQDAISCDDDHRSARSFTDFL